MPISPRSGRIEAFDVDEQSESSALHLYYIEQLSPGPLHSSIGEQPVPVVTYLTFSPESPLEFAATGELR